MRLLILLPILLAFAFLEVFIGGARLLYAVPSVMLLALTAFLSLSQEIKTSQRSDLAALLTSLLFTGYILARNRFSEVEYIARLQFFIMTGCLLIYLFFTLVLTRTVDRKRLFLFLGILALIQMIPAIIQFTQVNQWMPLSWAQRQDHGSWRASGFFISPNHFAGFLEVVALFAISFTIWGRTTMIMRILTGYTALACITGVALSGSRGGYLSMVFGSAVLLILTLIAWKRMQRDHFLVASISAISSALALLGGVLLLAFMSPTLGERVMQINDPANPRLILWPAAIHQFQISPIWGTGGFSYLYYGRLFRDPSVQLDPIHTHNDYLQLLADYGLVGMIFFIIFLIAHLRAGGASFAKLSLASSHSGHALSDRLALNIGALSAVAAYMVHSVVDFNMQLPLNALMMASVFAILANPGAPNESSQGKKSAQGFRTMLRYELPLIALALMIYGIPMIRGEYLAERARVALRDGQVKEALNFARQGTVNTHDNPELYFYRGEAALRLADSLQGKIEKKPLSDLQQESVGAFASGLKVFPYDSRLALKQAQALAAYGDYFGALASIEYAEKLDPNSGFVPAYRGLVEYVFGHYEDAKLAFQQSLEIGGQGAQIAQQGMDLVQKELTKEEPLQEITLTPDQIKSDSEESNQEVKTLPAQQQDGAESELTHTLPPTSPSKAK